MARSLLLTLPDGWREAWEERCCIMHYDAGVPWARVGMLALIDVLRHMGRLGLTCEFPLQIKGSE